LQISLSGRRKKALRGVAHQLGLTFEGEDWSSSSRAPNLESPLFDRGTRETNFQNIVSGKRGGMTVNFFDYSFRGRRSKTSQTVAAFTQDLWLPNFELSPQDIVRKLARAAAKQGIQLDDSSTFLQRFRLMGPDEKSVRKLFSPALVAYLEGLKPKSKWRFEASHFTLIIYRLGRIVKPAEYSAFVQETSEMARTFFHLAG
jgi:hypothetical protein